MQLQLRDVANATQHSSYVNRSLQLHSRRPHVLYSCAAASSKHPLQQQQQQQLSLSYWQPHLACDNVHRQLHCRAVDVEPQQLSEDIQQGPDLSFTHPSTGVQVYVFGVEHLEHEPHIGTMTALICKPAVATLEW